MNGRSGGSASGAGKLGGTKGITLLPLNKGKGSFLEGGWEGWLAPTSWYSARLGVRANYQVHGEKGVWGKKSNFLNRELGLEIRPELFERKGSQKGLQGNAICQIVT